MTYVNSYIESYGWVLLLKNTPEEKASNISTRATTTAAYDYTAAANYANTYYENYNTNYPNWSSYGDCANFISQCLFAGGKSMVGTGSTSDAENWSNWFSK